MFIDDLLRYIPRNTKENIALANALTLAMCFQVDNVARYVFEGRRSFPQGSDGMFNYKVEDQIPNIAPLAPLMWFEYGGTAVGLPESHHFGCFLTIDYERDRFGPQGWRQNRSPDAPHRDPRWILRAEYFLWELGDRGRAIGIPDWEYYILVNDEGGFEEVIHIPNVRRNSGRTRSGERVHEPDESEGNVWHEEIIIALLSICFSHCKGTVIEEKKPTRQVRRAAERSGKPVFSYHIIDINPSATVLRTEGSISKNGLAKALHICRGHFAHYTAEKPLFGKYTGTVYKPMHVRGSLERGIINKDYRVHAGEDIEGHLG